MSSAIHIGLAEVKLFLLGEDGSRAEISGLQTLAMKDLRDSTWQQVARMPDPRARVEMLVAQGEQESEGFVLTKAMKPGDPFNIELHSPNGKVYQRSYTFGSLVDETRIDDPAQFYRITVHP